MTNKPSKGKRAKTRNLFRAKRVITVNEVLKTFEPNDKVQIVIQGSFHGGLPFRRFQGLTGTVIKSQGTCYEVHVFKPNAKHVNKIVVHPVHLKKIQTIGMQ
ncbi:MAG: 50S ribosomal protein L21e [Candidatus Diapherotrites archaeon]|nr:50S ribosomal protein L21e [Candidatus Diapherotrites archaeon]